MKYFCFKLSNAPDNDFANRFCSVGETVEIQQLNQLGDRIKCGDYIFIFFGGDRVNWSKGLVGISKVINEPYDMGYDGKNNFKIKVEMKVVLKTHLKREYFIKYRDAYDAGGIGPSTKGEQNQAIKLLEDKQAIAIMRGMLDSENDILEKLKDILDEETFNKVIGEIEILELKRAIYRSNSNINLDYLFELENKDFALECINLLKPVCSNEIINILINKELIFDNLKKSYAYPILKEVSNEEDIQRYCFDENGKQRYYYDLIKLKNKSFVITNDWYYSNNRNMDNRTPFIEFIKRILNKNSVGENIILYGVPGSGKSFTINSEYCSDDRYIERLVFHPEYTYNDFVGQILPKLDKNDNPRYEFISGPFTRILRKAHEDRYHNYYLVIEEINRGNAPAIFGDIFQLLDRDETGESLYSITNYEIAKEVFKNEEEKIRIPTNLFILATMNTSDQNIFTLDTAFKRRWKMKLIENNIDNCSFANENIANTNVTWKTFVNTINKKIIDNNIDGLSNEDKRLGAYFISKSELNSNLFAEKVLAYLWDDVFKFERSKIFNIDKYKTLEDIIKGFKIENFNIFSNDIFEER